MKISSLKLSEVKLITPKLFQDDRGYFFEAYHKEKFKALGITDNFVQDNQSRSKQGTLRGLHFQREPMAQSKLVRVLEGEIFDVAVDIRPQSKTFKEWVGITLSSETHEMFYIPEGFAHGFYVLSPRAVILYKCNRIYSPAHDAGIRWDDPKINISWPINSEIPLLISPKDNAAQTLLGAQLI